MRYETTNETFIKKISPHKFEIIEMIIKITKNNFPKRLNEKDILWVTWGSFILTYTEILNCFW